MASQQQYSTNLGLAVTPEVDQKQYPSIWTELYRIRNALTILQSALDNYTGSGSPDPSFWPNILPSQSTLLQKQSRIYCITSEVIPLAAAVNFYSNAGVLTARLANATDATKPCRAFCSGPSGGVASGAYGEFVLLGINPFFSSLTVASLQYLSTSPGLFTPTAPVTPGNIVQKLGYALDSNNIYFNPSLEFLQL